jgi:integrase
MTARRRSPGEGGVYPYRVNAGERWRYKCTVTRPDGERRVLTRRGFGSKAAASAALRDVLAASARGQFTEPSRQPLGEYLETWLDGLRLAPSTVASYRKNIRLHVIPYIGGLPLASLTPKRLAALYRLLEASGRADHRRGEGLSARTVRYVATILHAALGEAAGDGLLPRNPADMRKAKPPSAKDAAPPEMHPWTGRQLAAFLSWAREGSGLHVAWRVLAMTGMRRGELLALRWRDADLDAGTVTVRRSAGVVRVRGEGASVREGPTKTGRPRVVDLDAGTVTMLRAWRRERGSVALQLARDDALVFGDHEGACRNPERFSRLFSETVRRARRELGEDALPVIRLHDLRHTHATLLLRSGRNIKVVSERLGHTSVTTTLRVYSHVLPGDQRDAAAWFAALIEGAP